MNSALEKEIFDKVFEITQASEGKFHSVNANDNGSYSVGVMQFHLTLAKTFFSNLASGLTSDADRQQALKYANMYKAALSSAEAKEMSNFLLKSSVKPVNETVQKNMAYTLIKDTNMKVAIEMYDAGILKDPRSIILIADIANTGPNHIKTWRELYKPCSYKAAELLNVKDSLKSSDSWWGRATSNQYYKVWMNRIENTYNKLASLVIVNDVQQIPTTPPNNVSEVKEKEYLVKITSTTIDVNGEIVTVERVIIDGNNFIKLQNADKLGFDVMWDGDRRIPVLTSNRDNGGEFSTIGVG